MIHYVLEHRDIASTELNPCGGEIISHGAVCKCINMLSNSASYIVGFNHVSDMRALPEVLVVITHLYALSV